MPGGDSRRNGLVVNAMTVRDAGDVSRARQFVLDECLSSGFVSMCDDAALLTSEVVTNAVRYAPAGAVTVRAQRDGDSFVVQVLDGSLHEPRLLPVDPWSENGRGLALVNSLAVEWGVAAHPSGKVIWFRL